MQRKARIAVFVRAATAATVGSAYAINHVTDYKTNLQNYRVCSSPELGTCEYEDVVSPSAYYIDSGKTVSLVYESDGDVQLRIDANTIKQDTDISYACTNDLYQCSAGNCTGLPFGSPPSTCTANRCWGGSNQGATCTVNSQCPGGSCSASSSCQRYTCHGGPRDNTYCGGGTPCESTNGFEHFKIVLSGNESGAHFTYPPAKIKYLLRGDAAGGCMVTCDFALSAADGSINTSDLSGCTQTGDCLNVPLESLHNVWLLDPDDNIIAIPGVGPATLSLTTDDGDPVKNGDCTRVPTGPHCP